MIYIYKYNNIIYYNYNIHLLIFFMKTPIIIIIFNNIKKFILKNKNIYMKYNGYIKFKKLYLNYTFLRRVFFRKQKSFARAHTKYTVLQFSELLSGIMLNLRCNLQRLHDVVRHSGYSLLSLFHTVCLTTQYISLNHCHLIGERMPLSASLRSNSGHAEIIWR